MRVGQTIVIVQNDGSGLNKAVVTTVDNSAGGRGEFTVAFYEAGGYIGNTGGTAAATDATLLCLFMDQNLEKELLEWLVL